MRIAFVHRAKTQNVGDLRSCPGRYAFQAGYETVVADIDDPLPAADWYVVGGGGLLHGRWVDLLHDLIGRYGSRVILWGLGENHHGRVRFSWPTFLHAARAVGLRDCGNPWGRVPCASCLAPEFATPPPVTEDVVVYSHVDKPIHLPMAAGTMDNGGGDSSFEEVINHLARGNTIVTNAYHGAYWGALLGRRVVVVAPFSNRFHGLGYNALQFVDRAEDWNVKWATLDTGRSYYELAIRSTQLFARRVIDQIGA